MRDLCERLSGCTGVSIGGGQRVAASSRPDEELHLRWISEVPLSWSSTVLLVAGLVIAAACGSRDRAPEAAADPPRVAQPTAGAGNGQTSSPIAGRWEADIQGDGKMFTFEFDFDVRGDSLGGMLSLVGRDGEVPITGTVKGNAIHFEQFGLWDGVLEGDTLDLSRGLDGGKVQHMTAHRAPKT
jgi:hypothetical protein